MLVFVDESGDAGLKTDSGSSPHFVIVLVVFNDHAEATRADQNILRIRQMLNVRNDFEFHFHKNSGQFRRTFLHEMKQFDFEYFGIVINKAELKGPGFKYPDSFYKYACKLVCGNAKDCPRDAKITIDGSGTREFKRQLATDLRKNVNEADCGFLHIRRVKLEQSHTSNLLQLADMIAGSVARSFKDKADRYFYREIMKSKETRVRLWPKTK